MTASEKQQPDGPSSAVGSAWVVWALLLMILAGGAYFRFRGLDWGLRHPPHSDEAAFVANTVAMVEAGDLDHRYYFYPGLFFYILSPGLAWLGPAHWHDPAAYHVARSIVAGFGLLNIILIFILGRRLLGEPGGLAAALWLAVSPIDIATSHQARPDTVLVTFFLLALLMLPRIRDGLRGEIGYGCAAGLAMAVKFTGVLLFVIFAAARLLAPDRPGRKLRGLIVVGALMLLIVGLATPAAYLNAKNYWHWPLAQLNESYPEAPRNAEVRAHLLYFCKVLSSAYGIPLGLSAAAGLILCLRRAPRTWVPLLILPLATWLLMSSGELVFDRYILPGVSVLLLLAAAPCAFLARRSRALGLVAMLLLALWPIKKSDEYVRAISSASAEDRALDWILANVPSGSLIVETRPDAQPGRRAGTLIGIPGDRYEMLFHSVEDDRIGLRLLVPHADLIISGPGEGGEWGRNLRTVYQGFGPLGSLVLKLRQPASHPRYHLLTPDEVRLSASYNAQLLPLMMDNDHSTVWRTPGTLSGDEWIRIVLKKPQPVGRLTLILGYRPVGHEPEIQISGSSDDDINNEHEIRVVAARPRVNKQCPAAGPPAQVLLIPERPWRQLTLHQRGYRQEPWVIAELRIAAGLSD